MVEISTPFSLPYIMLFQCLCSSRVADYLDFLDGMIDALKPLPVLFNVGSIALTVPINTLVVPCQVRASGSFFPLPLSRGNRSFQIICLCRLPYTLRFYVWCRKGRLFYQLWQDVSFGRLRDGVS